MPAGSTYTPIATTTLGSSAASYTFSSIPSTYTDLILVVNGTASSDSNMLMQFNSDTATNYSSTRLLSQGSGESDRITSNAAMYIGVIGTTQATSIIQIQNYANTTTFKTALGRANITTVWTAAIVGLWRKSPEAINSIKMSLTSSFTFSAGTTFTLYGIQAA